MNLKHTDTSINSIICAFDFHIQTGYISQTIEVPPLVQEELEERMTSNITLLTEIQNKKFELNSLNLKESVKCIIDEVVEYQGFSSLMKNIAECKIIFKMAALKFYIFSGTSSLLGIQSSQMENQFSDVFRFLNESHALPSARKTIEAVLEEKTKDSIVSVLLTERIGKFMGADMCTFLVNCEQVKEEQTALGSLRAYFTTVAKFANTINAFLTISPANEQIKTIIIHAPDRPATRESFMSILFTLLEINKIIIEEKTKIDAKKKFTVFYCCNDAHFMLVDLVYRLVSEYHFLQHYKNI
jgi:hypothetical protein